VNEFFADTDLSFYQHTLADSVVFMGRGLHTGLRAVMTVMPAPANTGIEFVRRDISHCDNVVSARWSSVSDTELSTTVSNRMGIRVSGIEHLLAALTIFGIDNAQVVIDIPEVPIMDGSALPFIEQFAKVGKERLDEERKAIVIDRPVSVKANGASASFNPSIVPSLSMTIDFSDSVIGQQNITLPVTGAGLQTSVASARTFGFEEQIQSLKRRGFARGSSLDNVLLVNQDGIVNEGGLRFPDEFVRHKCLSAIGDLTLAGHCIIGHFDGQRSGHTLNNLLLRRLLKSQRWHFATLREAHDAWAAQIQEPALRA
jgi:UDP-3-O-[3-hydroxymyristoyl] N-acetylglucosamine deacetylase